MKPEWLFTCARVVVFSFWSQWVAVDSISSERKIAGEANKAHFEQWTDKQTQQIWAAELEMWPAVAVWKTMCHAEPYTLALICHAPLLWSEKDAKGGADVLLLAPAPLHKAAHGCSCNGTGSVWGDLCRDHITSYPEAWHSVSLIQPHIFSADYSALMRMKK